MRCRNLLTVKLDKLILPNCYGLDLLPCDFLQRCLDIVGTVMVRSKQVKEVRAWLLLVIKEFLCTYFPDIFDADLEETVSNMFLSLVPSEQLLMK